ncbi:hypothetical protein BDA96_07G126500 [Sorghum bicolor]|jgi:hypothetical protein|uniref:Uncharacterized protein n=2 Tax=Sorghum bicolor TaxID=4558 RepID=A0A921QM69_SORBI|nr:hypothetical protein BDA96_07G126500 [Sorghum bicolor]KXG25087.1 hypothetical protein SORBI_3007G117900 [Sorghum bicolor]
MRGVAALEGSIYGEAGPDGLQAETEARDDAKEEEEAKARDTARDGDARTRPKERLQWDARNEARPPPAPAAAAVVSSMRSSGARRGRKRRPSARAGAGPRESATPAARLVDAVMVAHRVADIEHLDGVLAELRHHGH